jgi:uncharacterized membrane protein
VPRRDGGRSIDGLAGALESLRASFGFLPAVAILLGIALALVTASVPDVMGLRLPSLSFGSAQSARTVLSTIATATISVAGLAFSVTVVAFTLASSQLSPRVLRNFRRDRLSQSMLALLLGSFVYCIVVLVEAGTSTSTNDVPNVAITVAVVLALASVFLFAVFISHIVGMLQPSAVIESIRADGEHAIDGRYPSGVGSPAEMGDPNGGGPLMIGDPRPLVARSSGYLTLVNGTMILRAAEQWKGFVRQVATVGDHVCAGDRLAEVWTEDVGLLDELVGDFKLGPERTIVQDVSFPLRQLEDIALKALSPGINDPTTAVNAIQAMTDLLVRHAQAEPIPMLRLGPDGTPRFLATAPDLDDLVRLSTEQVDAIVGSSHPVVSRALAALRARVDKAR